MRLGIVNGKPRIQSRPAPVEPQIAMPLIGAVTGRDHHRTDRGSPGVGVFLRSSHRKFLNCIGRKILQEAANVVVRIISAINRKRYVQARAATERHRSDAGFGRVGRLDRFGPGYEICDIRKAAMGQRRGFKILPRDRSLMHRTGNVNRLGRDGRRLPLHVDRLLHRRRFQGDADTAGRTDHHCHLSLGLGKALCVHEYAIRARQQVVEAELSLMVGPHFAFEGISNRLQRDGGGWNAPAAAILYRAYQRSRRALCGQWPWQSQGENQQHAQPDGNGGNCSVGHCRVRSGRNYHRTARRRDRTKVGSSS